MNTRISAEIIPVRLVAPAFGAAPHSATPHASFSEVAEEPRLRLHPGDAAGHGILLQLPAAGVFSVHPPL